MFKVDLARTAIQLATTYSRGIRKVKVMDNRKEPPFFNEDNVGPYYYKLSFCDTMELFIETLTGTCFELRVSPFEAVISVKAKIQRLEGIPICQQHLIWNNMELEDDYCLNDYKGGSVYNLYTDEDEEVEPSPSGQQIIENSITMNKMKLLKAKMENMNLSKKPKKVVKVKPHPPIVPRPSSSSTAAARHRLLRVLPHIGQSCLSSPGNEYLPEPSRKAAATLATQPPADRPISSLTGEALKEENNWESNTLSHSSSNSRLIPQVPHMELESDGELAGSVLGSSLPRRTKHISGNLPSNNKGDSVLFPTSERSVPEESLLLKVGPFASDSEGNATEQNSSLEGIRKANTELLLTNDDKGLRVTEQHLKHATRVLSGESVDTAVLNHRELSPHKNGLLSPLRCSAPTPLRNSLVKPQRQSKCLESGNLPSASQNMLRSLDVRTMADSAFSRTTRFRGIKVDSPGKRSDIISKVEAQDITEIANKASKEPVGCVNNVGFFASLAQSASKDSLQSTRGAGRLRPSGIGLSTNLQHFQEESLRKSSPQSEPTDFFLSARGIGMNGNNAAAGKRVGESTHHLPPVKAPLQTKKKTTKHCFLCGKKTGLATSYECRCGNNFCASHRYAETHGCTYDYKSAGRRYLQEANPVVNAPKLPKI
ncbi:zinc finger AN1-type containing 4, transcript variant X10 [Ictidomys tridecemlineatus]|uniref:AN1-type zinc finger protein 4 isoform X4 n=2 Tax=Ictidomys tridecemlineatus TaxID=43179 RepID=UPI000B545CD8|nr:AN1-type zinc finger protein 4 isoform X4 [Ictidomys tridecemlineatus]KAG3264946.1 zinc finger AN1-type containing 4, transcript variant X10 [Ictidomys tridecemlineatus]